MTNSSSSKFFIWGAALFAIGAMVVHSILYSHHLDLHFGAVTGPMSCDLNSTFNCSAVTASRYSSFFGIPIALWGFAANFGFLLLLAMWPFTDDDKKPIAKRNLLLVSGFIAVTSIVMGVVSTLFVGAACIYCIGAYVLSFLMLVCTVYGTRSVVMARDFVPGTFTSVIVVAVVGFVGVFIADDSIKRSSNYDQIEKSVNPYIQSWQATAPVAIQTIDPLVKGPAADKARMTVVEFADFRCSHCKHAAPTMKAFSDAHPDVRFEFQAWPLDGECNSLITQTNGASCLLARLVWCAEKNAGQGWAMHDAIYAREEPYFNSDAIFAALPDLTKGTTIDPVALKACADSDEMKVKIRKMSELGAALNLKGTPTIFANGRLLPGGQTLPVLNKAYEVSGK
ncbi:MAG: vitamin K epoxide reductase family protein [Bdellovibrionota bacterium]